MKATIKKITKPDGKQYFYLYGNDSFVTCRIIDSEQPEDYEFSEKSSLAVIMAEAKILEEDRPEIIETVYETPNPDYLTQIPITDENNT